MNEWVRLADGTVVENAYIVKMDEQIAVYVTGELDFPAAYALFGDARRTASIHSYQYGDENDWNGYTVITNLNLTDAGFYVCLRKQAV